MAPMTLKYIFYSESLDELIFARMDEGLFILDKALNELPDQLEWDVYKHAHLDTLEEFLKLELLSILWE